MELDQSTAGSLKRRGYMEKAKTGLVVDRRLPHLPYANTYTLLH